MRGLCVSLATATVLWNQVPNAAAADAAADRVFSADEVREGQRIGSVQVYLTPAEARAAIFPDAARFERDIRPIPPAARVELADGVGRAIAEDSLEVWLAYNANGSLRGYTVITEETGKYRPITFMVGVGPEFRVRGAAVLVYRESRGGEVRRSRFLRQYRGKSSRDPIRINRDIINITGATLSVRALNFGVRKLVTLTEYLYGSDQPAPDTDTAADLHQPG